MAKLRAALLCWFDRHRRDLPWRRTRDPYAIWISEVMLQQTQVRAVIPYWEGFLARFPDPRALALAPLPDVLAAWRGLGYYARARNLKAAAEEICARFGGELPRTSEELRTLPGFGRYTAGAVASIAFGEASPVVDGNVARVLSRAFEIEGDSADRARDAELWRIAGELVHGERPGDFNQALMELGATMCRPEAPSCLLCPIRGQCRALAHGRVDELPPPKKRPERIALHLAVAAWTRRGRWLLGRRQDGGLFGGLWDLPSIPVASADDAAAKLEALLGRGADIGERLGEVRRTLTHRDLTMWIHEVRGGRSPRALEGYQELRWVTPEQAQALGMSTAMVRAFETARR